MYACMYACMYVSLVLAARLAACDQAVCEIEQSVFVWQLSSVPGEYFSLKQLRVQFADVSGHILVVSLIGAASDLQQLGVPPQPLYLVLAHISIAT